MRARTRAPIRPRGPPAALRRRNDSSRSRNADPPSSMPELEPLRDPVEQRQVETIVLPDGRPGLLRDLPAARALAGGVSAPVEDALPARRLLHQEERLVEAARDPDDREALLQVPPGRLEHGGRAGAVGHRVLDPLGREDTRLQVVELGRQPSLQGPRQAHVGIREGPVERVAGTLADEVVGRERAIDRVPKHGHHGDRPGDQVPEAQVQVADHGPVVGPPLGRHGGEGLDGRIRGLPVHLIELPGVVRPPDDRSQRGTPRLGQVQEYQGRSAHGDRSPLRSDLSDQPLLPAAAPAPLAAPRSSDPRPRTDTGTRALPRANRRCSASRTPATFRWPFGFQW